MTGESVTIDAVSVVMPCRNEARTIDTQLAALAEQDFDGTIEVVVVDNGSVDATAARARAWQAKLPQLRVVEARARHSCSYARNVGIAAASFDAVLVCDANDVVNASWVRNLASALQDSDVAGGGLVDWFGGPLPTAETPEPFGRAGYGFLPGIPGCNFGVRKPAWARLRGFDEQLVSCEDIDLAWRAQLEGLRVSSSADAVVYHRQPERPVDVFRKWLHYGSYQPLLYAKFRARGLPRQPPHRAVGRWVVLALTSYRLLLGSVDTRRAWCAEAGRRVGRVIGSVRYRSLYL